MRTFLDFRSPANLIVTENIRIRFRLCPESQAITGFFLVLQATMPVFTSRPLSASRFNRAVQKNPVIFGIPFILLMVSASYGLTTFTQTRYDLHDQKVQHVRTIFRRIYSYTFLIRLVQVTKEQELKLDKNRKKFDIREEYFVSLRASG